MSEAIKLGPKKVGIMLKPTSVADFNSILPNLVSWLSNRKISVFFLLKEEKRLLKVFKKIPKSVSLLNHQEIHQETELIISLGGDGTLIGIARECTKNSPPVFGVNMGHLGFITEFSKSEFFEELALAFKSKIQLKKINLFKVEIHREKEKVKVEYFLNDIVFNKNDIRRMINLSVESDEDHIYNVSGDGLIISSPIGSTAYSLAAGGPIIHPDTNSMILTPICPHSLTHRPLVISDKTKIKVRNPHRKEELSITLDGQVLHELRPKDFVIISKSSNRYIKLVKNKNKTYFHTLKEKFTHGRREL